MLRTALWTLRQRRYARLAALMLVVALICVAAGTWQISRFEQSVRDNDAMDGNAHAAATPLSTTLVPLVGHGAAPGRDAVRFRTVTVSGSYLDGGQQYLRNQSLGGTNGFYVLNPLRTSDGVLLVARGFVAATSAGTPPVAVAAPPAGPVTVTGRLQTASTKHDAARQAGNGEISSVNPAEQAARLGAPVYQAYLTLAAKQPGTAGVRALPKPDLSNPAGGAVEPQHFAYIIQWYLFALLALAAPFAMGRHELRDARQRFLGVDPGAEEFGAQLDGAPERLQLTSGASTGELATRANGTLARRGAVTPERWQRASRLADRYGRALGVDAAPSAEQLQRLGPLRESAAADDRGPANSAGAVHRSPDAYHGSYNDYLWQLALADGGVPDVGGHAAQAVSGRRALDDPAVPRDARTAPTSGEQPEE